MTSKEQEIIEQIKLAEQQAEKRIKDSKNEAHFLLEKAQSDRIRRFESAKSDAREILKKKIEEAKDTSQYEHLIQEAETNANLLREKTKNKIEKVAKEITDYILEIGKR